MLNENSMKKIAISIGICTIVFSLVAIAFTVVTYRNTPSDNLELVYIESVSIEEPLIKDEETTIMLNGWLPNSCWEYPEHHEIEINTHNKIIMIYLWAANHGGICLQYIRYFHYNISITFPSSGSWSIYCNGKPIQVTVFD